MRVGVSIVAASCAIAFLAGCNVQSPFADAADEPGASASSPTSGIVVFADSSLRDAFAKISDQFEADNPGVDVYFRFAESGALFTTIFSTASLRADVYASADPKRMAILVDEARAQNPVVFTRNRMEIAVPPANPANIATVADLDAPSVRVALCQSELPCGTAGARVFKKAEITVDPVTTEGDVTGVLSRVVYDEVDAGMVYATDVIDAGDKVKGVAIPDRLNASTPYPIAVLDESANPAVAQAFVDYVLSPQGEKVLSAAGFEKP